MDYYVKRVLAFKFIDKLVKAKASKASIVLQVMQQYGFSELTVVKYLNQLADNKVIKFSGGEIDYG
jgi:hypothetical protein